MDTNILVKNWFKQNWISIVLFAVIVGLGVTAYQQFLFNNKYETLLNKKYEEQAESFKKQINDIQTLNDQRFKENEALLQQYDQKIQAIDKQYKKSLADITLNQKKTQETIVNDADKDPSTLTKRFKDVFGIPIKDEVQQ